MRHVLAIDPSYQASEWGLREAVREIVSNARDAELEGKKSEIKFKSEQLSVSSLGVKLPISALLMGSSKSRERQEAIGTFGEGLPMALKTLAILKLRGEIRQVAVYNDGERWIPTVEDDPAWGAPVLAVYVEPSSKKGSFSVVVDGVSAEEWKEQRSRFLWLEPPEKALLLSEPYEPAERILLDKRYCGKVFVKGVEVFESREIGYGYDVVMDLNRDRSMVDTWSLRWKLQGLLSRALVRYPAQFEEPMMLSLSKGEGFEFQSSDGMATSRVREVAEGWFKRVYGEAHPCSSISESKQLAAAGIKGVVVSRGMRELLEPRMGTTQSVIAAASFKLEQTHSWSELLESERRVLERAASLLELGGAPELLSITSVVDFAREDVLGLCKGGQILLARKQLRSLARALQTLSHEAAHLGGADDLSAEHSELQGRYLSDALAHLAALAS